MADCEAVDSHCKLKVLCSLRCVRSEAAVLERLVLTSLFNDGHSFMSFCPYVVVSSGSFFALVS